MFGKVVKSILKIHRGQRRAEITLSFFARSMAAANFELLSQLKKEGKCK